ncbi:MAG: hypothetical protein V3R66_02170 [Rhodospirillales bacterium]
MTTNRRYLIVFLALSAALIGSLWVAQKVVVQQYFNSGMSNDDYLANLRDSDHFGCSTFEFRPPGLMFVGDSASYTAWDYNLIQRRLPNRSIAACTIGGFMARTLDLLVDNFEQSGFRPKVIVLGLTPFFFLDDMPWQLIHQKRLLESDWPRIHARKIALQLLVPGAYPKSHAAFEDAFRRHRSDIEAIGEEKLRDLLLPRFNSPPTDSWAPLDRTGKSFAAIRRFCEFSRRNGIPLYVIVIPFADLWWEPRPDSDRQAYRRAVNSFKGCAERVVSRPMADYGLGNRHFLNSVMSFRNDRFDYAQWDRDPDAVRAGFGPTHINLVGARRFTPLALRFLGIIPPNDGDR